MRVVLTMFVMLALVALALVALVACESPEAQRLRAEASLESARAYRTQQEAAAEAARLQALAQAEAERERARGQADAERQRARAEAEASMAATRQMERDAGHQRWMETLTTLGLIVLPLSIVAAVVALLVFRQRQMVNPALLFYLDRLQLRQAERERELWHALATVQRRGLPGEREVVIYQEQERRQ